MNERDPLDRLTQSLLDIERRHPGIPEDQRARLTARLARSVGAADRHMNSDVGSSEPATTLALLEGRPGRRQRPAAVGGASFSHRGPLLATFLRASAWIAISSPWALAAGAATIAGLGGWTLYGATHRASYPAVTQRASTARTSTQRLDDRFSSLPPLPDMPPVEAQPLPTLAPSISRQASPPAPRVQASSPLAAAAPPIQPSAIESPPLLVQPPAERPEATLLESARVALNAGDAIGALERLEEHRLRFPSSQLLEEREILTMEAELASGRSGAARVSAQAFLARHPDSLLAPRAQALLRGGGP
jgi:hypothetical protein